MEPTQFRGDKLEAFMQDYLLANPDVVPLEDVTGKKWHIVAKELVVSHNRIDFLGIDSEGHVYAIETKRKENKDSREVIAQLLDYASSLWGDYGDSPDVFWANLERNAREHGIDLSKRLGELAAAPVGSEGEDGSPSPEDQQGSLAGLKDIVEGRLAQGDFRLVAVTDELKPNVKAMIRFLNELSKHGDFGVLGVELAYFELEGDLQVVVPTVYGDEAWGRREQASGGRSGPRYDRSSFLAAVAEKTPDDAQVAEDLLAWCEVESMHLGFTSVSCSPKLAHAGFEFASFMLKDYGEIQIYFDVMSRRPPFKGLERRKELRDRLEQIPGVSIPDERLGGNPGIQLELLRDLEAREAFKSAIRWWKETVLAQSP